jgi:Thermostable hemolysin
VEQFISRCFERAYDSRIRAFMPRLFSLRDGDGDIVGAFGLRSASHRLYLEQYLEQPIEQSIRAPAGGHIDRKTIVEVGHFSGSAPGSVRAMIFRLTEYLHRQGIEWVAFTGTSTLRNAFHRMGLAPIDICAAAQDRLPPQERAAWGSYYDYAPHVLVGNVGQGYRTLLPEASR